MCRPHPTVGAFVRLDFDKEPVFAAARVDEVGGDVCDFHWDLERREPEPSICLSRKVGMEKRRCNSARWCAKKERDTGCLRPLA